MRGVFLVIALLCSIALLNQVAAPGASVSVVTVASPGGGVTVLNKESGYALDGHVTLAARASAATLVWSGRDHYETLEAGHPACDPALGGSWQCRLALDLDAGGHLQIQPLDGRILDVDVAVARAERVPHVDAPALLYLVAAISVLGLVFCVLKAATRARASVGALTCAGWIAWSGGATGLWLLALIMVFYPILTLQTRWPDSGAARAGAIGSIIVAFLVVKGNLANFGALFADPGGFALVVPIGFAFLVIRLSDLALRLATREVVIITFPDYLRYLLFPATFAAGPVQTWPQFHDDTLDRVGLVDWSAGLGRILVGIGKKLVADMIHASYVAPVLASVFVDGASIGTTTLWGLLVANAIYVYLDFSAYSDIAIGAGRQLGWRVPENFNFPFLRTNMREFWKNWHMSVSGWVMRWVHFFSAFPLRRSPAWAQRALPVIVSMTVIGLWHQPDLTWFLWGVHHAVGILLAGLVVRQPDSFVMKVGGVGFVLAWVGLSHAFTLVSDPAHAIGIYLRALGIG